ncbi:MAG: apolipoprotein N-acyltransferase [Candidatus Marinimicrobia bacterium]|nr:apolipoprotein N-acyltransferase [Candidatus Neomarinimicrobiota bacterium]|tara:strand:- start:4156 stop:5652 length:1497 start_codon:yes stop_codon:yes gene_type:complete
MTLKNNYFLVFISSLLMGLSQQPVYLGFLSWFCLVPFIYVVFNEQSFKKNIFFSLFWGFVYHLVILFWISTNIGTSFIIAIITMLISVLIMTLNTLLIYLLWNRISRFFIKYRFVLFVVVWVSVEFIRSYGLLGFPWVSLANSQIDYFYLIQNSEITGIYGISFWILLVNVYLYKTIFIDKKNIKILILVFLFPWISGYILYKNALYVNNDENYFIKYSILQPNINLFSKRNISDKDKNLEKLIATSQQCIKFNNSDLVIWPESAIPFHRLQYKRDRENIINRLLFSNNSMLLTGNIFKENNRTYNSSVLLNQHGLVDVYHKRQLVPLAEHVPLSDIIKPLQNINVGGANFSKGKIDKIFTINDISFTSMICYESTFPEINRRHVNMGADALVYLVNDGWYLNPPEPQQHARQSIYRAIENRRPVIRCANTGISLIINELGIVENKIELNEEGHMSSILYKKNKKTFYTKFGNVFSLILLIVSSIFFIMTFIKNEKKK